jgi:hypothetical protein
MPQLADEPDSNHFSCVAVATQAGVITITPHVNIGSTCCPNLKVHKIENFFGFDFEICTFS